MKNNQSWIVTVIQHSPQQNWMFSKMTVLWCGDCTSFCICLGSFRLFEANNTGVYLSFHRRKSQSGFMLLVDTNMDHLLSIRSTITGVFFTQQQTILIRHMPERGKLCRKGETAGLYMCKCSQRKENRLLCKCSQGANILVCKSSHRGKKRLVTNEVSLPKIKSWITHLCLCLH